MGALLVWLEHLSMPLRCKSGIVAGNSAVLADIANILGR